jgi:hypothetical protein
MNGSISVRVNVQRTVYRREYLKEDLWRTQRNKRRELHNPIKIRSISRLYLRVVG